MQPETESIEASLRSYLEPIARFAILFGSIVTDRFSKRSDVDCAALFDKEPTVDDMMRMVGELGVRVGREVDLIVLNSADTIITMQALANGKLLFARDIGIFHLFKAQKISEYIDFKRSRRIIEDAMLGRAA